jgi:hypothetical protein
LHVALWRVRQSRWGTQAHADFARARCSWIREDQARIKLCAIQRDGRDAGGDVIRIVDDDVEALFTQANPRFEPLPARRDTWIYAQVTVLHSKTKNGLDAQSPHPCGPSCVPSPTPATNPWRAAIDIASKSIRFDPIAFRVRGRTNAESRTEETKDSLRPLPVAEARVCKPEPRRSVRVLAPILANALRVGPNVSRVMHGAVERRSKEQHEPITAVRIRVSSPSVVLFERTAHDCAMESMRHSRLFAEPTSEPSSWKARRYQPPSHATSASLARNTSAWALCGFRPS